jgi:hypothetical protein
VTKGDRLWQKERLLNIGIERAKQEGHTKVACLDCDIIFENQNWFEEVGKALDKLDMVHCFSEVKFLNEPDSCEVTFEDLIKAQPDFTLPSIIKIWQSNGALFDRTVSDGLQTRPKRAPGMAWAFRIETMPRGFYDKCIIGGGDGVFFSVATGELGQRFSKRSFSQSHREDIVQWAAQTFPQLPSIDCMTGAIRHLWHGPFEDRNYIGRHDALASSNYNPKGDIIVEENAGLVLSPQAVNVSQVVDHYFNNRKDQ